jgi:hypothetical protein
MIRVLSFFPTYFQLKVEEYSWNFAVTPIHPSAIWREELQDERQAYFI